MRLSLLLFIIGVLFITAGYTISLSPKCEKNESQNDIYLKNDKYLQNDNNFKDSAKIIHNF